MEEELMKMRDATCYLEEMNYKITDKVKVDTQKKKRVKREVSLKLWILFQWLITNKVLNFNFNGELMENLINYNNGFY